MKNYNAEDYQLVAQWIPNEEFKPYSYQEFEQAFWHLWTLNSYHVTMSFDVNTVLLLDWAIGFHREFK